MRNINIVLKRRKRKGRKERNMGMRRKKERERERNMGMRRKKERKRGKR